MNIQPLIGSLYLTLVFAAPLMANPIGKPVPLTSAHAMTDLWRHQFIQHLSNIEKVSRTLKEAGFSDAAIAPTSNPLLADNIIIDPDPIQMGQPSPVLSQVGARFTSPGAGTDAFVGIEGFVPIFQTPGQNLTYIEGRLQISTENGALGGNALIGHRFLSDTKQQILGGYVSYDRRNTGEANFNQLGAGFEYLSQRFDVRANAYLPFGRRLAEIGNGAIGNLRFRANELVIDRVQTVQEALPGFDFELGTKLFNLGTTGSVRGYLGGYYYGGKDSSFGGFRSRLVARPTDWITAGLALQTDAHFDTRLIFSIGLQFPGSGASRSPSPSILARLGESPERQASILVDKYVRQTEALAINPTTGQPWQFQFVTLGLGSGDGTFEAPAGTVVQVLPTARSGGIVYVAAGSNPGIPGFAIPDGVSVISDAVVTTIPTQFGSVPLPNGSTGNFPRITSTVTLGNDTRLTGFDIANTPGIGIQGQNIRNITLTDNRIRNSGAEGIALTNTTGTVLINQNEVNSTAANISPSQSPGILLNNTTGTATATIADNAVSNTSGTGIVVNATGTAEIAAMIDRNRVEQPGFNGILSRAEGNGRLTAQVTNNLVSGTAASLRAGIGVGSRENGNTTVTVADNQVTSFIHPDAEGIRVFAEGNSQTIAAIARNTITDNCRGILVTAGTTTRVQVTIEDNTVTRNLAEGIFITGGIEQGAVGVGSPQVAAILSNNRVTDNRVSGAGYGDAVGMAFSPGTRVCLQLATNQIGTLTLADIANPALGAPFNAVPLSLLGGVVSVELPVTLTNPGTNAIATVSPATSTLWSRTSILTDSCRLP
jgi:hypothetical protein